MSENAKANKTFKRENLMRYISIVSIILLAFVFNAIRPNFLGKMNTINILRDNASLLVMAVGMTSVLVLGSIDLSMGAMCSVSNVLYVRIILLFKEHYTAIGVTEPNMAFVMFVAISACLLTGFVSGLLLGVIHVKLKVPSFIASLAFMSILISVAYFISNRAESIPKMMWGASTWYKITWLQFLPLPLVIAILIALLFYLMQKRTVFGRTIFAIGGNERASRIAGMGVDRTKIIIFTLNGMCAALGGVFLAAKIMSSDPTIGDPFTLMIVASCVLGGTSLAGGKGTALGTILGALTVNIIKNGLTFINVDAYWQDVVFGSFVLLMIIISIDRSKSNKGIVVK